MLSSSRNRKKIYSYLFLAVAWAIFLSLVVLIDHELPTMAVEEKLNNLAQLKASQVSSEAITPLPINENIDKRKVQLGKKLFTDVALSANNSVSCATCHDLNRVGVDNLPISFGLNGQPTQRNTPTVFNSGFNYVQFWDGRAVDLEEQVAGPLLNAQEMGNASWLDILKKLSKSPDYIALFSAIYQTKQITDFQVRDAIATFERALVSPAPFDDYLNGNQAALTAKQKEGYQLFKSYGCISCHHGVNVGGAMFEKIGVVKDFYADYPDSGKDLGRYDISGQQESNHEFKVPSLRNVAMTSPYLHDGSIKTLRDMIILMAKYQLGVTLSEEQIDKIEAFLESLTGRLPEVLR